MGIAPKNMTDAELLAAAQRQVKSFGGKPKPDVISVTGMNLAVGTAINITGRAGKWEVVAKTSPFYPGGDFYYEVKKLGNRKNRRTTK